MTGPCNSIGKAVKTLDSLDHQALALLVPYAS